MADGLDGARRNQQSHKAFGTLSYSPGLALRISIRRCPTCCNALNLDIIACPFSVCVVIFGHTVTPMDTVQLTSAPQ